MSLRFPIFSGLQLLLGYLPLCPEDWSSQLARRRTQYHVFCDVRDGAVCRGVLVGWDCRPAYSGRACLCGNSLRAHLPCCSTLNSDFLRCVRLDLLFRRSVLHLAHVHAPTP